MQGSIQIDWNQLCLLGAAASMHPLIARTLTDPRQKVLPRETDFRMRTGIEGTESSAVLYYIVKKWKIRCLWWLPLTLKHIIPRTNSAMFFFSLGENVSQSLGEFDIRVWWGQSYKLSLAVWLDRGWKSFRRISLGHSKTPLASMNL